MAVIAPPRRPDSHDAEFTVEPDRGGEALIEEAKQHARLRRRRVAVTAIAVSLAVAGAVTAALVAGGAGSSSSGPPSSRAGAEGPAVEAVAGEHVDAVASWAEVHTGWVAIFSDGLVLSQGPHSYYAQRLSPTGLGLVGTGRVPARDVFLDTIDFGLWAAIKHQEYVVAEYAACPQVPASTALDRLPNAVRDVVQGTQRRVFGFEFDTFLPSDTEMPPADWSRGNVCFVLAPAEVSAIALLSDERSRDFSPMGFDNFTFTSAGGEPVDLFFLPILPDGRVLFWGG